MRSIFIVPVLAITLPLALVGCGNSTPLPATPAASASASATPAPAVSQKAYIPSVGAFAPIAVTRLQQVTQTTDNCNLDAVDGKSASDASLPHAGSADFTGWAADGVSGTVPANVQLILTGTQDFVVDVATGLQRNDVAKAQNKPAFATSGYQVKAGLSAVPAGEYGVTLLYSAGGHDLKCATPAKLSVK